MDYLLKQRLIGAAVIIALAVIILPMIFQGKGQQGIREIPNMPEVRGPANKGIIREQPVPQPGKTPTVVNGKPSTKVPGKPAKPAATEQPSPATTPATPAPASKPESKPAPKPVSKPGKPVTRDSKPAAVNASWAIQVGSFSTRKRAMGVRDRLRKSKYPAYVDTLTRNGGKPLYRVRIGPFASKPEAEQLLKRLRKKRAYAKSFLATHP